MKTIEIIGYKRANLGKSESRRLRKKGMVPSVVYGKESGQIHFYAPMILFRELVYTDEAHFVLLTIEGESEPFEAILQAIQFHPVSEIIMHTDFLRLKRGTNIKMEIPIHSKGVAPGLQQGGKLIKKVKYLSISALPKNMPEFIEVDISQLDLGKSVKVGDLSVKNYEILNNPLVTLLSVEVPRVLKGKDVDEESSETSEEQETAD